MKNTKHIYSDVFYSNINELRRSKELEKLEKFLERNMNLRNIFLVKIDPKSKEISINKYDGNRDSLIPYVFIRTDLAGVGNYNFVIECGNKLLSERFNTIVKKDLNRKFFATKNFFENKWTEELINEGIVDSILVTYCDGVWVELLKR